MNDENELLEPLATEAGQEAIVRAIRDISSLEYAVRAEQASSTASVKAGEASQSASEASEAESKAKDWATKTDTYVEQQIITIPPAQEGEEPTTETINLYSARYYAALALDIYNNMSFDSVPTENSTNMVNSGVVYSALDLKADKSTTYTKTETDNLINTRLAELVASAPAALDTLQELATALGNDPNFATTIATQLGNKADKSDTYTKTEVDTALNAKADLSTTYTKTEVDTALSNVQSTLTFDNVPTANSDNPVKSSGIKTALDSKQNTLTFDSTPTANSTNPITSGGVYTALQNVNIDIDDEITEDSDNPVTSAAIYEALLNFTPSGGGGSGSGNASGTQTDVLYENNSLWTSGPVVLSNTIDNYDLICFEMTATDYPQYSSQQILLAEELLDTTNTHFNLYENGVRGFDFDVSADRKTLTCIGRVSDLAVRQIYGIKFSKNLSEQMYSNVLYKNLSSGFSSGTLTLSDEWDNYDFIVFLYSHPQQTTSATGGNKFVPDNKIFYKKELNDLYTNEGHIFLTGYGQRFMSLNIGSDKKTFSISERTETNVLGVYGYKLAKGGYSGIVSDARMTVKSGFLDLSSGLIGNTRHDFTITFDSPMPDINYEVMTEKVGFVDKFDLTYPTITDKTVNGFTISIYQNSTRNPDNVNSGISWIAIRPNSYTREGMVEDVLFSSENGTSSGIINLSGNISDYDLIQFTVHPSSHTSSLDISASFVSSNELINKVGDVFEVDAYDDRYMNFNIISDNLFLFRNSNGLVLYKITGIKFGRYVSGVAVDTTVTQNSNAVVTSGAVYTALQNAGGSSITVDSTITQGGTNPVEGGAIYTALGNKADQSTTYTKTEVDTALANKGDVTTNTDQNITGTKTFVGSKKVAFKQSTSNDKLGFTLYGNTGTERGYLEFNPTNTVDGVTGLMTLGNYATSAAALTQVGFRRYSNISGASGAYNLLMPMVADARTPFSLTTTYQNFYLPLGFTDGTTTVKTAKSGVVDLSPLLASLEARIAALEGN